MSPVKRALGGLCTRSQPRSGNAIPAELLYGLDPGDEVMNYQGALFINRKGSDKWSYEGQEPGAADPKLREKSPMTFQEIERHFAMERLFDLTGGI